MGIFMAWLEALIGSRKLVQQLRGIASSLIVLCILSGCTSESIVTPDSRLTITPASSSFDIVEFRDSTGNCVYSPEIYQDVPVSLVLTDDLNRSLGNALVTVYVDYTGNTFSGPQTLQLYVDSNGNRVIDTVDELVSGVGDEAFTTRSAIENGTISLLLRINLSCGYRGSLYAFAGPVAGTSSIIVNNISERVEEVDELQELTVEPADVLDDLDELPDSMDDNVEASLNGLNKQQ